MDQLIVITPDALQSMIRNAVTEALAEHQGRPQPLLDRSQLAETLQISESSLDTLRKAGLPSIVCGQSSPRFELAEVIQWLKNR